VLFTFLVNASGAIMLLIYLALCLAYLKLSRVRPDRCGGVSWREYCNRAGAVGTALVIVGVMVSMVFIKGLASQLYASLACVACAVMAQRVGRGHALRNKIREPGSL